MNLVEKIDAFINETSYDEVESYLLKNNIDF